MNKKLRKYQLNDLTEKEFKNIVGDRFSWEEDLVSKRMRNNILIAYVVLFIIGIAFILNRISIVIAVIGCIVAIVAMFAMYFIIARRTKKFVDKTIDDYKG